MAEIANPVLKMSHMRTLLKGRIPGQLVIQYSDSCNAQCPQCSMRVTNKYPRSKLQKDEVKKTIDAAVTRKISAVSFTGGEPLLFLDDIIELIEYAGDRGIEYIRTGTNGFLFRNAEAVDYEERVTKLVQALAATKIRNFWISIDAADAGLHEQMRGLPGVLAGIRKALPIFHAHGIYPTANLGINRNTGGFPGAVLEEGTTEEEFVSSYKHAFRNFYRFVVDLGFTITNCCYPMSVNSDGADGLSAVYGATSGDRIIHFSRREKALLFRALYEVIPEFRDKIRIFTPRTTVYSLIKQYSEDTYQGFPCRGGIDFFFIDAKDGCAYPCGYRGNENMGKFWELDMDRINPKDHCTRCDWECFRDPSELLGNAIELMRNPIGFSSRMLADKTYAKLLMDDTRYYKACDYFDGRRPPELNRLHSFQIQA